MKATRTKTLMFAGKDGRNDFGASALLRGTMPEALVNLQLATRHAWYVYTAATRVPRICAKLMRSKTKVLER